MKRFALLIVLGTVGSSPVALFAQAQGGGAPRELVQPVPILLQRTSAADAKGMFVEYCAACHGQDGKGSGPVAGSLKTQPTDLTQLSARNGGIFPTVKVERYIQGLDEIPAHGTRAMPLWGLAFGNMDTDRALVELRMNNLTNYLKAFQARLEVAVPVANAAPQRPVAQRVAFVAPRTADGQPDLQGIWDFRTGTPLERPKEFADKPFLRPDEIAAYEKTIAEQRNQDRRDQDARPKVAGEETTGDVARAYNDFWWDFGKKVTGSRRTSLIVDPPDGRIPALTEAGKRREADRTVVRERIPEAPVDRGVSERCMMGFNSGPPMNPSAYNNNMQFIQSRDSVAIVNEMVHNARIIPVNGRSSRAIPQWAGQSIGRWDGETFVVETQAFYGEDNTSLQNQGPNLKLTERFTLVDPDVLKYEYTVNDPTTWTQPWSVEVMMVRSALPLYEYACHEGNYGMPNSLSAARYQERISAETAKKGSR